MKVQAQQKRKLTECASSDDLRRSKRHLPASEECCLFCSQKSANGKLHQCTTMELDHDLQKMAHDLQDTSLIAKLSAGDLIAIEAKYPYNCLSAYKNYYVIVITQDEYDIFVIT